MSPSLNLSSNRVVTAEVVISRYDEAVDWLPEFAGPTPIVIYNKGTELQLSFGAEQKMLPNVGREGHTFLTHIIENYANLKEVTIFLQGRIDDLIDPVFANAGSYLPQCMRYGFSAAALHVYLPMHWKQPFPRHGSANATIHSWQLHQGLMADSSESMLDYAVRFLGCLPPLCVVSHCGCFAASRDAIWAKPLSFYEALRNTLSHHPNPLEGHYMERMWCYLFSGNRLLPAALNLSPVMVQKFQL